MLTTALYSGRKLTFSPCLEFLDNNSDELVIYASKNLDEKKLLLFLKNPLLPEAARLKALGPCMERGCHEALSLLLSLLNTEKTAVGPLSLQKETLDRNLIAEKIWKLDKTSLITRFPALAPAISALKCHFGMTAADVYGTDGRFFYGNTEKIISDFLDNEGLTEAIYLHSVLHCLYLHPFFHKDFLDQSLWDLCYDIAVWDITLSLSEAHNVKNALPSGKDSCNTTLPRPAANIMIEEQYRERNNIIRILKKHLRSLTPQSLYRYFSNELKSHGSLLSGEGPIQGDGGPFSQKGLEELSRLFQADSHSYWYENGPLKESLAYAAGALASSMGESENGSGKENAAAPSEREDTIEANIDEGLFKEWKLRSEEIASRKSISEVIRDRGDRPGNKLLNLHGIDRSYGDWGALLGLFSRIMERPIPDPSGFDPGLYNYGLSLYGNMPIIEPLE